MDDTTRYANQELRHQYRDAGVWHWGPFYGGRTEIQTKDFGTRSRQIAMFIWPGVSIMVTLTRNW